MRCPRRAATLLRLCGQIALVHTTIKRTTGLLYPLLESLARGNRCVAMIYRVVLGLLRPHGTIFVFLTASPRRIPSKAGRGTVNRPPDPALKIFCFAVRKQGKERRLYNKTDYHTGNQCIFQKFILFCESRTPPRPEAAASRRRAYKS